MLSYYNIELSPTRNVTSLLDNLVQNWIPNNFFSSKISLGKIRNSVKISVLKICVLCSLGLTEHFLQELKMLRIITGFSPKDGRKERVSLPKTEEQRMSFHSRWDFCQSAEGMRYNIECHLFRTSSLISIWSSSMLH